ncbi:MAG: hypothetical protein ACOCY1_04065 [Halovenus sp.]
MGSNASAETTGGFDGPTLKATLAVKPGEKASCDIIDGHADAAVVCFG